MPAGLTFMHTHSCRQLRNKIHTKMQGIHTYTYQAHVQDLPQTSKLELFATFLQSREQTPSQMLAIVRKTSLHIQLLNILQKKIKNKKKTDPSLLHLSSQYVFRFQSLYAYISRQPVVSHLFLSFLVLLKSFKHICFSILQIFAICFNLL